MDAVDLRVGDQLLLRNGQRAVIEVVEVAAGNRTVYNFSLPPLRCYAVGQQGVLVHNNCAPEAAGGAPAPKAPAAPKPVDPYMQRLSDWAKSSQNPANAPSTPKPPRSVGDILSGTTPGRATKGPTTQVVKKGGMDQANADFDDLGLSGVKDISTVYGPGRTGTYSDGRQVTVRPGSTDGRPTLEIRKPNGRGHEIRYEN